MQVDRSTPALIRLGAMALFIAAPIVVGIALVSLALAYSNPTELGAGIALLGAGLGAETIRTMFL